MHAYLRYACTVLFVFVFTTASLAQSLLDKTVSLNVSRKPLKEVLRSVSNQGGFYFSYNSDILNEDSLVSVTVHNKTVKQVLDILFGSSIVYKEKEKHIILQKAEQYWYVSGYVFDELTGEGVGYVSVYEKQQLVASMTNEQGYFQLKIKDRSQPATISVSKAWYADTSIAVKPGQNQELKLKIKPKEFQLDSVVVKPTVEKNWLGRFFLSSKQQMQSINLKGYFVDKPYQASVIPGVSTHGKMGSQIVNKFSFNLLGGYTAGVNGFEIGGLFNITKKDMHYAQVAGIFNVVGGHVGGVQVAGLYNQVLDSITGVQVSGLASIVKGHISGVQVSGLYSHTAEGFDGVQIGGLASFVKDTMNGLQVSGLVNMAMKEADGTQIAGLGNINGGEMNGAQISGLFNYAKRVNGFQIGLLNIADTSTGCSIGIFNLIWKGYHKLSISANEMQNLNVAFKAGNQHLYSILLGGMNVSEHDKVYSFGYGFGSDIALGKKLYINPELVSQYLYLGDWEHFNLQNKLQVNLNYRINKFLSVYAGPSVTIFVSDGIGQNPGYRSVIPAANYATFDVADNVYGWFGWNAGINIF